MVVRDRCYIACVCAIDDPALIETTDVLGVDFGIVSIATDSDGECYTGGAIEKVRAHLLRRRAGLQHRATKPAKRRLRKLSGRQRRF
jgi:transposase